MGKTITRQINPSLNTSAPTPSDSAEHNRECSNTPPIFRLSVRQNHAAVNPMQKGMSTRFGRPTVQAELDMNVSPQRNTRHNPAPTALPTSMPSKRRPALMRGMDVVEKNGNG